MPRVSNRDLIARSSRPDVFCKRGVLRNFAKLTRKHLRQILFFNKVAGLRPATLLQKSLWHRYFPVNFMKFLRTAIFVEHLWWLLLNSTEMAKIYMWFETKYSAKTWPSSLLYIQQRRIQNPFQLLSKEVISLEVIIFTKKFILDVWKGSEYAVA